MIFFIFALCFIKMKPFFHFPCVGLELWMWITPVELIKVSQNHMRKQKVTLQKEQLSVTKLVSLKFTHGR